MVSSQNQHFQNIRKKCEIIKVLISHRKHPQTHFKSKYMYSRYTPFFYV